MVNFMCPLAWAMVPRHLVKHYSGCFCEYVFWTKITFWGKQAALHNVGGPHSVSRRPSWDKDWPTQERKNSPYSSSDWTAAYQASLSITNTWSSPKLMSIESAMPSSHLILYCPLLLLPPIPPSIRVFSKESILHMRWLKYWSFSFSISPSNEYSGLISLRMDWLDLLAVQGTLKSLLQHHSSKASILQC